MRVAPEGAAAAAPAIHAHPSGRAVLVPGTGHLIDAAYLPLVLWLERTFHVRMTSGWRSPAENRAAGGAADSDHLKGRAADFSGSGPALQALYRWAAAQHFPYVESPAQARAHGEGAHVHVSFWRPGAKPTPPPSPALHLSERGALFIARWEGFVSHLYNDAAGHCTIGVGHLVHLGACNRADFGRYGKGLSYAQGIALLRQDAAKAGAAVRACVRVKLAQHEYDALVSFTFNCGGGALQASSALRELNAGRRANVPAALGLWTHAGGRVLAGLVRRRAAEGALFAHARYGDA